MRPYRSYTSALAFNAPPTELLAHPIPTASPVSQSPERSPILAQRDHALYSSTFFPPSSAGFVTARVVGDGYVLELRWVNFITDARTRSRSDEGEFAELDQQHSLPPVHFVFPAPLLPTPTFYLTAEGLQVLVATEEAYFYSLVFTTSALFYSPTLAEEDYSVEYKLPTLDGHNPVLLHAVEQGKVVIACADGFLLSVEIEDNGGYSETELRSNTSFSVRSLLPSFSTRNSPALSSPTVPSSPSQIVSLASSSLEGSVPFAFGVSRDRKLKIWNLDTGVCSRAIDLPRPVSSSTEVELIRGRETDSPSTATTKSARKGPTLLSPTPTPFVKIVLGSELSAYASYLVLFVTASAGSPPAFFFYGISTDEAGAVSELTPVGEQICESDGAVLVDYEFAKGSGRECWTLWSLWEEGGEAEVRFIRIPTLGGEESIEEDEETEGEWTKVGRGSASVARWNSSYFDQQIQDSAPTSTNLINIFTEHIFYPGRYSATTLEFALDGYEDTTLSEIDPRHRPEAFSFEYESTADKIRAIVGCTVQLEISTQTGAFLHEAYNKKLKVEWLKFVAMCNESRAAALFPTALAGSDERGLMMILTRDAIVVPIIQDSVGMLERLEGNGHELAVFMNLEEASLEGSYASLAAGGVRQDIFSILSVITSIQATISRADARELEDALLKIVRTPLAADIEDISLELFDKFLAPNIDDTLSATLSDQLRLLGNPSDSLQTLWRLVSSSELIESIETDPDSSDPISELSAALLADQISLSIDSRYSLVKGLIVLMLYLYGEEGELLGEGLSGLANATFASFHTLSALKWITKQGPPPILVDLESDQSILERFGEMKMDGNSASPHSIPSFSLLNSLLLNPSFSPALSSPSHLSQSLTQSANDFLSSTGLLAEKLSLVDTPEEVSFALRLVEMDVGESVLDFVEMFQGATREGMRFVKGLCLMRLDDERMMGSVEEFSKAAAALYDTTTPDESGLSHILHPSTSSSLANYYTYLVGLYTERSLDLAIITFAPLALEAFSQQASLQDTGMMEEDGAERKEEEEVKRDLWLKLFMSYSAVGRWEDAYLTLMSTPYEELKSTCLSHLISVLCENGQVASLTTWSFVGLQGELERTLAFRTRNSDPLAEPNYYKILYAYQVAKGDYRSAGATMLQQARRIGDLCHRTTNDFRDLATLQCHSYLASINSLSLVEGDQAWVTIPLTDEEISNTKRKRKITYHLPEVELDENLASRQADVMDVGDIRREYTILLSRLLLIPEFPELARSSFALDPESIVALFSQTGAFDSAFSVAITLKVDMSSLFQVLTTKCVDLESNGFSQNADTAWLTLTPHLATHPGPPPLKAYSLLRLHLTAYDSPSTSIYHFVVLRRILEMDRRATLPDWLVEELLRRDGSGLGRVLWEFGRLEELFGVCERIIKNARPNPSSPTSIIHALPYHLFDSLLGLAPSTTPEIEGTKLSTLQETLRSELDGRLRVLEGLTRGVVERMGR